MPRNCSPDVVWANAVSLASVVNLSNLHTGTIRAAEADRLPQQSLHQHPKAAACRFECP